MPQTALGAFTLNAWQQVLMICGSQYQTDATVGAHTLAPGAMTGFLCNYLNISAAGAVNITTRTAAQLYADLIAELGQTPPTGWTFEFEVINNGGGQLTLVGGAGVTINGTATIANGASRWFTVTIVSPNVVTIQNVGSGTN